MRRFEASGRSGRSTGPTYETRLAARAADIPVRRVLGWCEAGVFQPTIPASGKGSRRRFTRGDIVALVLIAELQKLFGPNLRPGRIARDIAEQIDDYRAGGFLCFRMCRSKVGVEWMAPDHVARELQRHAPVTLLVHLDALVRRVDEVLRSR